MPFPVEERYIEIAEAELGVRFPASFRNKMMALNGGYAKIGDDDEPDYVRVAPDL